MSREAWRQERSQTEPRTACTVIATDHGSRSKKKYSLERKHFLTENVSLETSEFLLKEIAYKD